MGPMERGEARMISVAIRGYGIVLWEDDGSWRTFTASERLSAFLATRVEAALEEHRPLDSEEAVCAALLSISGAHLLAVDCDHGPGGCEGEFGRN